MNDGKTENESEQAGIMADDHSNFEVGTRCRLSELGKSRNPKLVGKVGKVLRKARTKNQVLLLFDGYTTPITLHRSYVEAIPAEEEPANSRRGQLVVDRSG